MNNQQSHIINTLLVSFAWFIQQVMDPCFFFPCFHGPRFMLGPKREGKNLVHTVPCHTDLALS